MLQNKEACPERQLSFLDVAKILNVLSLGAGTREVLLAKDWSRVLTWGLELSDCVWFWHWVKAENR